MPDPEIAERFGRDTARHEMSVLHDDGLYRHLRFRNPAESEYWFDLITWPGCLTINGDMDTFTFARTTDMFELFRSRYGINPQYWAEKARAVPRDGLTRYDESLFRLRVFEAFSDAVRGGYAPPGLAAAIRAEVLGSSETGSEDGARGVLRDFEHDGFRFSDVWEWDLCGWSYQYLWCCHAIQWGIGQYDAHRDADGAAAYREHREREMASA